MSNINPNPRFRAIPGNGVPTAAKGVRDNPFAGHRTMAQVMQDEALAKFLRLPPEHKKGRTVKDFAG